MRRENTLTLIGTNKPEPIHLHTHIIYHKFIFVSKYFVKNRNYRKVYIEKQNPVSGEGNINTYAIYPKVRIGKGMADKWSGV